MDNECPICLENLSGLIIELNCKHKYHGICIEKWFNSTINNIEDLCPQCNEKSSINKIYELKNENGFHQNFENNEYFEVYQNNDLNQDDQDYQDDNNICKNKKCCKCIIL